MSEICSVCKNDLAETKRSAETEEFYQDMMKQVGRDMKKYAGLLFENSIRKREYEPCRACKEIKSKRRLKMLRLWGQ